MLYYINFNFHQACTFEEKNYYDTAEIENLFL